MHSCAYHVMHQGDTLNTVHVFAPMRVAYLPYDSGLEQYRIPVALRVWNLLGTIARYRGARWSTIRVWTKITAQGVWIMALRRTLDCVLDTRSRPLALLPVGLLALLLALGIATPTMAAGDTDGDGLINGVEGKYGTDRKDPDTDDDGLSDGDEVYIHTTDPLDEDSDNDWLMDGDEVRIGTLPLVADTEGDRLTDGVEVLVYFTDPLDPDTDGDVLSDYTEVTFTYTNPRDWDTDGDFVNDRLDLYPLDSARW